MTETDVTPSQDDRDAELLAAATAARERSHVPYSGFSMGAAVRTESGTVRPGALIENVSLGLAMCPDRVALFSAVAEGSGTPMELALVSRRTGAGLTYPCGACLQVALELGGPDLRVVVADLDGLREESTVGELLPRGPQLDHLTDD